MSAADPDECCPRFDPEPGTAGSSTGRASGL